MHCRAMRNHDICHLQSVVRELAKRMGQPTERHFMMLQRAGRYLLAFPRVVQRIPMQRTVTDLSTSCDADHAGCIRSPESTAGVVIVFGSAVPDTVCIGQALIALSSAEYQVCGLTTAASESLGERRRTPRLVRPSAIAGTLVE